MIDFSKIGTGSTVDTVIPPREIFNALPDKDAKKFQYPRDVQSQVWAKWFDRRSEESLVIKMNTGSGKTIVGLLILKSCLNEGKGPAVYICPDKYLVQQVMGAARELGVEVTDDANSVRFLSGKAILVANIFKLINGMSVFGVGDEGVKIKISSLIIDDAHACLQTVEEQFTINIPVTSSAYQEIFTIFLDSLKDQCESKAIEIESGDPVAYLAVPYWAWQEKISEITRILVKNSNEDFLKFVWPLVKELPKLSHCIIGSSSIEISPYAIPIHVIPSIANADRKVFMTATLVDDSIIASHFGVQSEQIRHPIVPDSASDVGDRMILLPQVINTETTDADVKAYCKTISEDFNVVVIVPSNYRAKFWKEEADLVLTATNMYDGIEKLKGGHVGLTILVNKYDGIDLPGDSCRVLVIDGFPDVRRKIDKVEQSILLGSERNTNQVMQRIEQGMGRAIRSNDDYCVVFLIGRDLTRQLYSQGAIDKLSPATRSQVKLSDQVSEQIKGKAMNDLTETINLCLGRNSNWVTASKGVLASLKYSEGNALDVVTIAQRKAYDYASNGNPIEAAKTIQTIVAGASGKTESGFLKQVLATYTNLYDKAEAQKIQMSAANDNRSVLKPIDGIQYHKIAGDVSDQATSCSNYLARKYHDPNVLIIAVNGILDELQLKPDSANIFEENLKEIARFLGFDSQRPEQEFKKGPDVLWSLGALKYLVIECKSEATTSTICKDYCNQLNGSGIWFETKYGASCLYTQVMVHPATIFEYAASPKAQTRIITATKLADFCTSVREFIKSVASNNEIANPASIRTKLIAYKLRADDIIPNYTVSFTLRNQP